MMKGITRYLIIARNLTQILVLMEPIPQDQSDHFSHPRKYSWMRNGGIPKCGLNGLWRIPNAVRLWNLNDSVVGKLH